MTSRIEIEITERFPFAGGMAFGDVGPYERIKGRAHIAVDPKAPGGGFYGPLFVTNGPPVLKPLIRPGSNAAVAALWQVAERETGLRVDVKEALAAP